MKLKIAIVSVCVAVASPVFAADLPSEAPAPAPYIAPPVFTWAGLYVGVHVGYAGGQEHDNLSQFVNPNAAAPVPVAADSFNVGGVLGGVHAGYNFQSGNFVYGFEGDFDGANITGSHSFSGEYVSPAGGNGYDDYLTGSLHLKADWQASFRLRAGFAFDRWLIYATGGVAFGSVKLSANGDYTPYSLPFDTSPFSMSASNTLVGWTIGAGTEYAFTNNWIGRLEVRYTDLGSGTFNFNYFGDQIPVRASLKETVGLIGLSYKF